MTATVAEPHIAQQLALFHLEVEPTTAMLRGDQWIGQCAWCGLIAIPTHTGDLTTCPSCGHTDGWWKQQWPTEGSSLAGLRTARPAVAVLPTAPTVTVELHCAWCSTTYDGAPLPRYAPQATLDAAHDLLEHLRITAAYKPAHPWSTIPGPAGQTFDLCGLCTQRGTPPARLPPSRKKRRSR